MQPATRADVGKVVRYWHAQRGWRIGRLLQLGPKWAKVKHPVTGPHKVAKENVERWQ